MSYNNTVNRLLHNSYYPGAGYEEYAIRERVCIKLLYKKWNQNMVPFQFNNV